MVVFCDTVVRIMFWTVLQGTTIPKNGFVMGKMRNIGHLRILGFFQMEACIVNMFSHAGLIE
jgi:hypothetical protein